MDGRGLSRADAELERAVAHQHHANKVHALAISVWVAAAPRMQQARERLAERVICEGGWVQLLQIIDRGPLHVDADLLLVLCGDLAAHQLLIRLRPSGTLQHAATRASRPSGGARAQKALR